MANKLTFALALYVVPALLLTAKPAAADLVSPHYEDRDAIYSKEPLNSSFFGTGVSGRMNEASMLRFEAEQALMERKFGDAMRKAGKALQLDPGDPSTHLLYARSLTGKLYSNRGSIDEPLLRECIAEWKLIWRHSTDYSEQQEARRNAKVLIKIDKELAIAKKERTEFLAVKAEKQPAGTDKPEKTPAEPAKPAEPAAKQSMQPDM